MAADGIPILIVEDNPGDVTLLRMALKKKRLDGELTIVRDGNSALKFADTIDSQPNARLPHLVILDLNLPIVDGREILKRFRASGRLNAVPIVILSSSDDERDKVAVLSLGATRVPAQTAKSRRVSGYRYHRRGALVFR